MYKKTAGLVVYLYKHHFVRYLFVGGTSFIIDFGTLVLLHGKFRVNLAIATSIAYWLSIIYNFTLNRWWTFSAGENKKLHQHLIPYGILLAGNYVFTVLFVGIVSHHINYAVAKTLAVILQTTWTYQIYKKVIFSNEVS